jgi:glycolate oxidase FAD binding subunit
VSGLVDGVPARTVEHAESVAHVQEIVRAGRPLVASGLGAHLDMGAPPRALDTLLQLDRLGRIVDHQAADMTVTVEAGCSLATLAATLDAAGQWLPIDPPGFDRTSVGGLIAANLSGPLRASQGTVRDLLLGLTVVGFDGAIVRSGGRVVKNVAGYDLPKLHVGALGSLGVIVEATFKVRPRPERESAAVLRTADESRAMAVALDVRDVLDPLWLEAGTLAGGPGVAVGLGTLTAEIDEARRRVEAVAQQHRTALEWHEDGSTLRMTLGDFPMQPAAAVLRASVLPGDVGMVVDVARGTLGADVPLLAQVANGVVHVSVRDDSRLASALTALRRATASRGGFVVVERATASAKELVDVWGDPGEGLGLMQKVKATYDPAGIFAPGRFVGGL